MTYFRCASHCSPARSLIFSGNPVALAGPSRSNRSVVPVSGVAAVGQAPSNSEPIRSGHPPCAGTSIVLAVDNASVRLARSHVHTGFTERLPRGLADGKRSVLPASGVAAVGQAPLPILPALPEVTEESWRPGSRSCCCGRRDRPTFDNAGASATDSLPNGRRAAPFGYDPRPSSRLSTPRDCPPCRRGRALLGG